MQNIIEIQRALDELKRGYPIIIDNKYVIMFAEYLCETASNIYLSKAEHQYLLISDIRSNYIANSNGNTRILDDISIADTHKIIASNITQNIPQISHTEKSNQLDGLMLKLAEYAMRLPAIMVGELKDSSDLININSHNIEPYPVNSLAEMEIVADAPLTLKNAANAHIYVMRSFSSNDEHYAINVGDINDDSTPLVRIHSSCYTGDILASRACDCGEQLDEAINKMFEAGGGVILYLMQEGRGIGLANKIRCYKLQRNHNMDTVEANNFIGMGDDIRPFEIAAKMLEKLSINKVELLTNNPRKIKGLQDCGVEVISRHKHKVDAADEAQEYLKTKFSKLGHLD